LGEQISKEFEVTDGWLRGKFDFFVVKRLASYFKKNKFDAVVTVGAGDKMFWGRMSARLASVPVICSALHSTGWPDGVGKLNRFLTPITDAFIAVAKSHGRFLVDFEKFPANKVVVIPNGVDTDRFYSNREARNQVREELGLEKRIPLIGIVAALRHEKNHGMFVDAARKVVDSVPAAQFVIIGEGPERANIEARIHSHGLQSNVRLLGNRFDTERLLAAMDVFALTSHNEASPVSILEALSCEVPVVSTNVGSVAESVHDQWNGFTVSPGDVDETAAKILHLLRNPSTCQKMGANGREHVQENGSLNNMVRMYEELIHRIHDKKS
jgi:glycosyltransferase involved in cell wall biosynthesis